MSAKGWILLAILFVMAIFAYDFMTKTPKPAFPLNILRQEHGSWKDFTAEEGYFTVKFPNMPQTAKAADTSKFKNVDMVVKYNVYAALARDGSTFLVKRIEYPEVFSLPDQELIFDDVQNEMLKNNAGSSLISSQDTTFQGERARDIQIQAIGFVIKSRAFFVKNTLYILTVMDRTPENIEEDFQVFTRSFSLLTQ